MPTTITPIHVKTLLRLGRNVPASVRPNDWTQCDHCGVWDDATQDPDRRISPHAADCAIRTPDAGSAPSFNVIPAIAGNGLHVWRVHRDSHYVDTFMTDSGARHAARMLNAGGCTVNPHAPVGCRIMPAGLPPLAPMHGQAGSGA